jgi:hypothetical protein
MRIAPLLAASVVAIGLAAAGTSSQAAQSVPQIGQNQSLVQPARYGRCIEWRHICADRWGWGSWRFRRCLRLHAC